MADADYISFPLRRSFLTYLEIFQQSSLATDITFCKRRDLFDQQTIKLTTDMAHHIPASMLNAFPMFDGEYKTLSEYLEKFDRTLNVFGLNRVKALRIFPLRVTGRAERAYRNVMRSGGVRDFQTLIDATDKQLTTVGSIMKAKHGLTVGMKETESLPDFAERIRRNILQAYPHFAETHQEILMADYFVKNLPKTIRGELMSRTYDNLSDALERAEHQLIKYQLSGSEETMKKF